MCLSSINVSVLVGILCVCVYGQRAESKLDEMSLLKYKYIPNCIYLENPESTCG